MKMNLIRILCLFLTILLGMSLANFQVRAAVPNPEVTFAVNEEFLNAFLDSMFTNLKAPSTPLVITPADKDRTAAESYGCPSVVTLERAEGGIKTAIKLEQGKMTAPMAFSGAYNSTLLGCIQFRGWANTSWVLEFDRSRQALLARIQVDEIHLNNVPALAGGSLTKLVQTAIDQRVNPLELVKLDQLTARVPVAPAGGALRFRAKDLRSEISPGNLQLHVTYEVLGDK
jgi:hypothetical protein